jgi:hypothetical protein
MLMIGHLSAKTLDPYPIQNDRVVNHPIHRRQRPGQYPDAHCIAQRLTHLTGKACQPVERSGQRRVLSPNRPPVSLLQTTSHNVLYY